MRTRVLKVNEFAEIYSGGTPSTNNPNYWHGDISWITPKDMSTHEGVFIERGERFITEEGLRHSSAYLLPANTVIISSRAPVGYVAVAKSPLATNQGCKSLKCKEGIADPLFIYYLLKTNTALLEAHATGSTYKELSLSRLRNISFKLPVDIEIQSRIASILLAYDDLIENNRRRIQLLEQAARLLYKEWFVHLRFPGHEHVRIKDGIPEGWQRRHLSELVDTQYGYTETATKEPVGPKFLRGTDINKTSYIDWSNVPYCPEANLDFAKYALKVGDIVVIRMADPGKVAIIEKEIKAVFASYLVRLSLKNGIEIHPLYLFYVLSDDQYQGFISGASGGATRKSASANLLVDFNLIVPSPSLISLFVDLALPLRRQITTLLDLNASLRRARDLLLPRLMNGEITV
jgi:type I restriction enzyme S subunit